MGLSDCIQPALDAANLQASCSICNVGRNGFRGRGQRVDATELTPPINSLRSPRYPRKVLTALLWWANSRARSREGGMMTAPSFGEPAMRYTPLSCVYGTFSKVLE
jgi:hypothetical protein